MSVQCKCTRCALQDFFQIQQYKCLKLLCTALQRKRVQADEEAPLARRLSPGRRKELAARFSRATSAPVTTSLALQALTRHLRSGLLLIESGYAACVTLLCSQAQRPLLWPQW